MAQRYMTAAEVAVNFNITHHSARRKVGLEKCPMRIIDGQPKWLVQVLDVQPKKRIRTCQKKPSAISFAQTNLLTGNTTAEAQDVPVTSSEVPQVVETPQVAVSMREFVDAALVEGKTTVALTRLKEVKNAALLFRDLCTEEKYDRVTLVEACDSFLSFVNEV